MRRLHPASGVLRALNGGVSLGSMGAFGGFGIAIVVDLPFPLLIAALLGAFGFVVGVALGTAQFYRFSYDVTGDTLSIGSGVFDRQERDIPLSRIQNVDIRRNLLNRILGIAVVRFETAGGSSTEGVLNAVSVEEARRLQDAVANRREEGVRDADDASDVRDVVEGDTGAAVPVASEPEPTGAGVEVDATPTERPAETGEVTLFSLTTGELALLSLVTFRPAAPALVIFGLPILNEVAISIFARTVLAVGGPEIDSIGDVLALPPIETLFVIAVGGIQLLLVTWVTSALITANQYYDFELTRVGDDLRYERGFLQRYSGTIPLGKVQTVTIKENVLMRRVGYGALALETAGYGPGQSGGGQNTAIPLDDRKTVMAMAERLGDVTEPRIERPPNRARRRYVVRFGLVVIAISAVLFAVDAFVFSHPWWIAALALVVVPLAGHYRWLHRGHATTEPAFVARQGFWRRQTRLVPYYRIQTVIDTRTIFQRWRNLASVTADTASTASIVGGNATAHDIDEETARDLHATLRDRLAEDRLRKLREGKEGRTAAGVREPAGVNDAGLELVDGEEDDDGNRGLSDDDRDDGDDRNLDDEDRNDGDDRNLDDEGRGDEGDRNPGGESTTE